MLLIIQIAVGVLLGFLLLMTIGRWLPKAGQALSVLLALSLLAIAIVTAYLGVMHLIENPEDWTLVYDFALVGSLLVVFGFLMYLYDTKTDWRIRAILPTVIWSGLPVTYIATATENYNLRASRDAHSLIYLLWDLRLVAPLLSFPCHIKNIKKLLKKDYKKCQV
jgi:hypothetical protein